MSQLEGRVVIVTGAGRGIGREHALLFASLGAKVVVNDLGGAPDGTGADASAAQSVVDEIVQGGGIAVASVDSVASFDGSKRIVDLALEAFGDLHVVVNNAGISRERRLVETAEADFDDVIEVNLKGTFNLVRHAGEHWARATSRGSRADRAIVNTSSGAGLHGFGAAVAYSAAKAGVAAITQVAAIELAEYGVRVNCIAPIALTRMAMLAEGASSLMQSPVFDPGHISPLVAVLAAPDCRFNGQVFSVCGPSVGIYAGWAIADEVRSDDRWTFDALRSALEALPTSVPVRGQGDVFLSLAGLAPG